MKQADLDIWFELPGLVYATDLAQTKPACEHIFLHTISTDYVLLTVYLRATANCWIAADVGAANRHWEETEAGHSQGQRCCFCYLRGAWHDHVRG
jgi:hypothetical protein